MLFEDADLALATLLVMTAIGQCIAGAQTIANRRLFEPGGALEWRLVRRHRFPRAASSAPASPSLDSFTAVGFGFLKCVSSLGTLIAVLAGVSPVWPLVGLVVANAMLAVRVPFGTTGADQMGNVLCVAALLATVARSPLVTTACLLFVAFQSSLCYSACGVGKLARHSWRDGSSLTGVLLTDAWGSAWAARLVRRVKPLGRALSVVVVAAEVCFPLLLLLPVEFVSVALLAGVVFHALIAAVMGINTFLWIFPATYPAVMFANSLVRESWLPW